jgi:hypothetical protein
MTTLIPMAAPDTCPTTFINSAGSVDCGAMRLMKKKNPAARAIKRTPVMTTRQFLRLIVFASSNKLVCDEKNFADFT